MEGAPMAEPQKQSPAESDFRKRAASFKPDGRLLVIAPATAFDALLPLPTFYTKRTFAEFLREKYGERL